MSMCDSDSEETVIIERNKRSCNQVVVRPHGSETVYLDLESISQLFTMSIDDAANQLVSGESTLIM